MARKLRIQYPGAIYHIMNRGDRREDIVWDPADRGRFVETLGEACSKTDWQVHAWWREADLQARRKSEPGKVRLAHELRAETTMPLAWIAARLSMGSRGYLAWLLAQRRKAAPARSSNQPMLKIWQYH